MHTVVTSLTGESVSPSFFLSNRQLPKVEGESPSLILANLLYDRQRINDEWIRVPGDLTVMFFQLRNSPMIATQYFWYLVGNLLVDQ